MEKSRAIELLKLAVPIKALTQQEYADFVEAVNMGMDALEQPTSPDTIDRQAVIKVLECWQKAFKENSHHASASDLSLVVKDIRALSATHVATDTNVGDKISKFINGLEEIFADLRERHVDDSVCGLCEYDGAYMGQSGDWCNECPGFGKDDCFKLSEETRKKWTEEIITICKHVGNNSEIPNSSDCISRQQAIDALDCINGTEEVLRSLSSAQPEPQHGRIFREIVVEYPSISNPEHKGKPYFSIKYVEDGQEYIGYGTYKPEVLSEYLKEYFIPSAQPEYRLDEWCHDCKEYDQENHCCPRFNRVIREALKDAQPEPKEGHWIPHETPDGGEQYECSRCGVLWEFNDGSPEDNEAYFCPKCGADMRGDDKK